MNTTNFTYIVPLILDETDKDLLIYTAIKETTIQLTQTILTTFIIGVIVGIGATIFYYKVLKK